MSDELLTQCLRGDHREMMGREAEATLKRATKWRRAHLEATLDIPDIPPFRVTLDELRNLATWLSACGALYASPGMMAVIGDDDLTPWWARDDGLVRAYARAHVRLQGMRVEVFP